MDSSPVQFGSNNCRVMSQPKDRYPNIKKQISSAYPVIHERVLQLYLDFLEYKCLYGESICSSQITVRAWIDLLRTESNFYVHACLHIGFFVCLYAGTLFITLWFTKVPDYIIQILFNQSFIYLSLWIPYR